MIGNIPNTIQSNVTHLSVYFLIFQNRVKYYLRNGKSCRYGWSWHYRRPQEEGSFRQSGLQDSVKNNSSKIILSNNLSYDLFDFLYDSVMKNS